MPNATWLAILASFLWPALAAAEEAAPAPAPKIATGAWAEALKEHPRLLGPAATLKSLAKDKPDVY